MTENTFQMVAKTFKGLEEVLANELISLGAKNVEIAQRAVTFEGNLRLLYAANLCCRTALRILKPIFRFEAADTDDLYDRVRDSEWERYMTPDTTFAVDVTANSSEFTHSRFATYRVKDGIADHFSDACGRRPSVRLTDPDIYINVHIFENRVTISLDSSGEPLNRRGYRQEQTDAPINEVLAAGIILLSGWRGDSIFCDPMCGSGTFLIEAALIAANINPGIYRRQFAFEKWPGFDADLFREVYEDDSQERPVAHKILGGDMDPEAVAIAQRNIKAAHVEDFVDLTCRPMADWKENDPEGVLVMNPPYGTRLKPDDLEGLYREIGTNLKRNFKGWHAWIIGPDIDAVKLIGLKPSVKIPLLNGSIECLLREYVLFDGRYDDFRAEGKSVRHERGELPDGVTRARHLSDKEWRRESGARRPERKPFRDRDDRKSFRGDKAPRKPFRRDDDNRNPDRRKPFRGDKDDRRPFRRDGEDKRRPFHKDDKRQDRRNDRRNDHRDDRRDDQRANRRDDIRRISDRGPRLDTTSEVVFNKVHMRSRKGWKKDSGD